MVKYISNNKYSMKKASEWLELILSFARLNTILSRKLDAKLGGIWFSDFLILYTLAQESDEKMRRIDLAEAVWLTASGVTRILLPMEKIGLVIREAHEGDARVSFVKLAPGWKAKLKEALERAELYLEDIIPSEKKDTLEKLTKFVHKMGKKIG